MLNDGGHLGITVDSATLFVSGTRIFLERNAKAPVRKLTRAFTFIRESEWQLTSI